MYCQNKVFLFNIRISSSVPSELVPPKNWIFLYQYIWKYLVILGSLRTDGRKFSHMIEMKLIKPVMNTLLFRFPPLNPALTEGKSPTKMNFLVLSRSLDTGSRP